MRESTVQNLIRLEAARLGVDLWRNNTGQYIDDRGIPVRYGLCNESKQLNRHIKSSDLIGVTPTQAYIEGVGWIIVGVFTAIECKAPGWKFNPKDEHELAQLAFCDIVRKNGGYAGFATSVEEFRKIVGR